MGRGAKPRIEVERSLAEPGTLAAAARLLLDEHFTPTLADRICVEAGLDLPALEVAGSRVQVPGERRRQRRSGFTEEVLRAYAYQCSMCGFDGALGRHPVGIEAAHVQWHSQDGPDVVSNALALCALHHDLFDLGVLGITPSRRTAEFRCRACMSPGARQAVRSILWLADRCLPRDRYIRQPYFVI
jgi:putative restriction endonuclease